MVDKKSLEQFIESRLADTPYFLVAVSVSVNNEIKVDIDSFESVDIDFCIKLSQEIESEFPRDPDDYELEVGSAGLTSPFRVKKQYEKNVGKEVEVLARDGKKYIGILQKVGDEEFSISTKIKEKIEGSKRPVSREVEKQFAYQEVNSVKYVIKF